MAKKTYTEQDRLRLREALLDRGQALFARHGYREAPLKEVYEPLGISKTFFYTFFPSKEALALQVLRRQREKMLAQAQKVAQDSPSWRASLEMIFDMFFHSSRHGVFTLELADLPHLCRHMSEAEQRDFGAGLTQFYQSLLRLWDIPATPLECQLIQNMTSSLLLTYHSHLYSSIPFHPDLEDETMALQVKLLLDYLEQIHDRLKSRPGM